VSTYSYAQLERLWINAGGSKSLAPVMAAIAMAESSGNSTAYNPSGATGLWQILGAVNPSDQSKLTNPQVNAHEAVLKYRDQGLSAWETYTNGAYKQFLKGNVPPSAKVTGSGKGSGGGQPGALPAPSGALADVGALVHGAAIVLDRFFALATPGQGWRIVYGAGAVAAGAGAFKAYTAGGQDEDGGPLPLAIALVGVAVFAAFMAMRPWPQTAAGPIKPGAYMIDIAKGEPPPAGPRAFSSTEIHLTEAGLITLLSLWAAGKTAQAANNVFGALAGGAAAAGGVGKVWRWIRGIGKDVASGAEDVAGAAGEAA
jgi:hypothetical protein